MVHKNLRPADVFDKKDIYKASIEPKVRELMLACHAERLPMFVSVAVKNSEEGTTYENNVILGATSVRLKDNRLAKILLYINHFSQDGLPEDVDAAIVTLYNYLSAIGIQDEPDNGEESNVFLTDDQLSSLRMIAEGKNSNQR